jgi:LysR family transcriptional regulator, transcriptional activator for dmlA
MTIDRDTFAGMGAFLAAVEEGSFSRAATKLGLTPSGVSKLVARLEEKLDVRLFHRTTRQMQLTDIGTFYLDRARRIFDDVRALQDEIERSTDEPRGLLRVTAPVVLGHHRVLPAVISFRKAFPEVKVALHLVDHLVDLVDERIDVAVRMTASPPLSYVAKKLGDDTRRLCASHDYLARRGRPARPSDLQKHDCLVFVTEGAPVSWKLRSEAGKPVSVRVCGPLQANNTLSLRQAALAGLGIADLPSYLVADDVRAGRLEPVLEDFVAPERAVYALYAAGPSLPARSREFVKLLVRHFHEDEAAEAPPARDRRDRGGEPTRGDSRQAHDRRLTSSSRNRKPSSKNAITHPDRETR